MLVQHVNVCDTTAGSMIPPPVGLDSLEVLQIVKKYDGGPVHFSHRQNMSLHLGPMKQPCTPIVSSREKSARHNPRHWTSYTLEPCQTHLTTHTTMLAEFFQALLVLP